MTDAPHKKRSRGWIIGAVLAVVAVLGEVAIEVLSDDLKEMLRPYRIYVWSALGLAFIAAIWMRTRKKKKGSEPDACFYVQSSSVIGNRIQIDFAVDPPPEIVVEVDVHHDSRDKFSIYAALGVPEIWRYDGQELTIHILQEDQYVSVENSAGLPMLSGRALTDFLAGLPKDGESQTLVAFDEWIQSLPR